MMINKIVQVKLENKWFETWKEMGDRGRQRGRRQKENETEKRKTEWGGR